MTLLRASNTGELLQILNEERRHRVDAPEGTVYELEVDDETNAPLLADLIRDINNYRLIDGNLTHTGVAVSIQPPSPTRLRLLSLRNTNQTPLDENAYQGQAPLVQQLAAKLVWLELEWRALQRDTNNR